MNLLNLTKYFHATRLETRVLRLREASLIRSRDTYKHKVEILQETVRSQEKRIKELEEIIKTFTKETNNLKELLEKVQEAAKKYAGMLFKSNTKKKKEGGQDEDGDVVRARGAQVGHKPHHRPTLKREDFSSRYALSITEGALQEMLGSSKKKFSKEYKTILTEIRNAPIKHADETSFRIEGMNGWCWLFATPRAALYTIEETRGKGVPERILGRSPTGLLVRDDYGAYMKLPMAQQSCWAHLLRVSREEVAPENSSEGMKQPHQELKTIFLELNAVTHEPLEKEKREKHFETYTKSIRSITDRTYEERDERAVQTRIARQDTKLITALLHEDAPLTNNHAEKMIRSMVVARKISRGCQSVEGAAIQAVNMTIMQTLSLRGKDFFTGVREILEGGNQKYGLGRGE